MACATRPSNVRVYRSTTSAQRGLYGDRARCVNADRLIDDGQIAKMTQEVSAMVINEIFKSIQGESSRAGLPCVFVRTAYCPERCSWCDTAYAYYEGTEMSVEEVLARVRSYGSPLVELTGGEPLIQPDSFELIRCLLEEGFTVLIETSGTVPIDQADPRAVIIMDIKCPGSGMSHKNRWENIPLLKASDEVKFVIRDREDYEWAKRIAEQHRLLGRCVVLFSPVFDDLPSRTLAEWILADNLPVRFQIQMHKYVWDPQMRGV